MRTGNWTATISGTKWFITDPHPEDVRIGDIAHGLSHVCRFSGQVHLFYSVAEHSVRVAMEAERRGYGPATIMWALLHDATEAYMADLPRPLKQSLLEYKAIEARTEEVVLVGLGVNPPDDGIRAKVKKLDDVLLMTERRDLVTHCGHKWTPNAEPLPDTIIPWSPVLARRLFLEAYERLTH